MCEKLKKLNDGLNHGSLAKEEFAKKKQELEIEYMPKLAGTIAIHETFLKLLADHPIFKLDGNLRVFLEGDASCSPVETKSKCN